MARIDRLLKLYGETIQSPYMHYGYWDTPGDVQVGSLTLADMIEAQKKYIERVAGYVPNGVESILDVGCGLGGNSEFLRSRGFTLEGLSPDPYQEEVFEKRFNSSVPFHLSKYETFEGDRTYDLILMCESASYVKMAPGAQKSFQLLEPGGFWLVSDYFIVHSDDSDSPHAKSAHPLDSYLSTVQDAGFDVRQNIDVTENVMPTLDALNQFYDRFVSPTIEYAVGSLEKHAPKLMNMLKWSYGRKLNEKMNQLDYLKSDEFRKYRKYMILLFQKVAQ